MRTYATIAVFFLTAAIIFGACATAGGEWHAKDWWTFLNRVCLGIATASAVGLVKAFIEWQTEDHEEEA